VDSAEAIVEVVVMVEVVATKEVNDEVQSRIYV